MSPFLAPKGVKFFSSGCTLLNLALGGGWGQGRIVNVIGDRSTGKTLLAIEGCANFLLTNSKGLIRYKEAEAAFDESYAELLGMPLKRIDFAPDFETVEEFQRDLTAFAALCARRKRPGLYVLDSLDALSDKAEMERDIEKASYGGDKAKQLSQMFRKTVRKMERANVTLFIISQTRDKIGVMFGKRWTRSGGKALDFYASQIVYLAEIEKLKQTYKGAQRTVGVKIRAQIEKNKCGLPFRQADFPIRFGYGIDDDEANLEFLQKVAKMKDIPDSTSETTRAVKTKWMEIETHFLPTKPKYAVCSG